MVTVSNREPYEPVVTDPRRSPIALSVMLASMRQKYPHLRPKVLRTLALNVGNIGFKEKEYVRDAQYRAACRIWHRKGVERHDRCPSRKPNMFTFINAPKLAQHDWQGEYHCEFCHANIVYIRGKGVGKSD